MKRPAIVFIGFMGAGKSSAALTVEAAVGGAEDMDVRIERRVGLSVRELFEKRGEEEFRRVEEEVASEILSEADGGAIALGGGSVLSERISSELADHLVVWLDVDPETAWERVVGTDRPLAQERARFDSLFAERRPLYESLADAVLPVGDPEMVMRALPSIEALRELPAGTKMLWASSASGEYPVFVGSALLGVDRWPLEGRRFCVTDSAVGAIYADRLAPLEARIEVEPGEAAKTMDEAEQVLRELARAGMTREDHVIALGGGVVGDLGGFCAHVYQRGVAVVQVPTTLVAQVDSAYGGKTGVDLPEGKNYAGAYHLPAAVIADTETLASLPPEELAAGFVEVLKTGLLAGGALWERVRGIESLDSGGLGDVVFACARYKCEVVAADERDSGLRHTLNLGHTVGHAIEAASGYSRYRHGEAVGIGLLATLRLSGAAELRQEVEEILRLHRLPVAIDPAIDVEDILTALQRDKKRTAAGVGFVLLPEPGRPRTGQILDPDTVRAAVLELHG
ncbi:MAG TPA: bifunctional shikimate kinase/3-dehydroquinate synthase [Solirubrobacterales bacterium]|nr:bifunctional shikimate kinase/3-dehydroquinate synthase [Solirubrobacterales bacterium]